MSLAPETAVGPLAEAPPDRPTRELEQLGQQFLAVALRDGGIDQDEQRIIRGMMETIAMAVAQRGGGGIGALGRPSPEQRAAGADPGMSPMEMNASQSEEFGAGQGEPTGEEY